MTSPSMENLLKRVDIVLAHGPVYLGPWARRHAGARLAELELMYSLVNGFLAFDRALRVFPAIPVHEAASLNSWNEPQNWRDYYGDLAKDLLFFADDVFGGQFCIKQNKVFAFDPETGDLEWLADDLEAWAAVLLDDTDNRTGRPLAVAWQARFGPLAPGQRLLPTRLFTLGGEFSLDNLTVKDATAGMRIRGPIAQKIHDLPDGAQLQFEITD
ncbi:hypothetical protein [Nannocystis bainbridge]|uniref:SMI1/KNR4 family protein n=1 Tax=Nannocystis bainbridge TaxID=2995303 RepID=A0ABT5EC57_9BACT|nr:hypothetical protein [Nannocystis bainbridge]MDC0722493.1 hypothetical protein [Nannocystis bainbridge]